ncbi:MAG: hypothetical protein ACYDC8_17225 [Gammaproteobacteria bacterium]
MAAKYILIIVGAIFLLLALGRIVRDRGHVGPASRTWLLIALVFGAVSLWLWTGGHG